MSKKLGKTVKMWNNMEKTVKNVKKPQKTVKNIEKSSKMSKNSEKIVKNVQKPGKNRQKFGKTVKMWNNMELEKLSKCGITWKKPSKMSKNAARTANLSTTGKIRSKISKIVKNAPKR